MLLGTADPQALGKGAPTLRSFEVEPLRLEEVETLQILSEIKQAGADALLPPGLHPTIPRVATWWVQRVADSPWGPLQLAQFRIECRSGLRPRGFLRMGVIDNGEAAIELAARWAYRLQEGEIVLDRSYDRISASVAVKGQRILEPGLRDPTPLRASDAYYVANMNLAQTSKGLRLIQVDPDFEVQRAERGKPWIELFDAAAWQSEGVSPSFPVAASFSVGVVTLPSLRYVCRPDVLAFQGTERVDQ